MYHRCLVPFPELGSYAFSCGTASFVRTMRENADWILRPALPISDVGSLYLRSKAQLRPRQNAGPDEGAHSLQLVKTRSMSLYSAAADW